MSAPPGLRSALARRLDRACRAAAAFGRRLATCLAGRQDRPEAAETRLRLATEDIGLGSFDLTLPDGQGVWSRGLFGLLGLPLPLPVGDEATGDAAAWHSLVAPEDLPALQAALAEARASGAPFRCHHRIRRADDGSLRWLEVQGRWVEGPGGPRSRLVGIAADATARLAAEERERLRLREVEHRAKNLLQVVRALLHGTPAQDHASYVAAMDRCLGALGRAQSLLAGGDGEGAAVGTIVEAELAHLAPRLRAAGAAARLRPRAAQGLALLLQELATNAVKYGALSRPEGMVALGWAPAEEGRLCLSWVESGGPALAGPPARTGFGSRLMAATARGDLGGAALFDWRAEGLAVTLGIAADRWQAEAPGRPGGE